MTVRLNPYLSFRDNTRAAMQFYQTVFGGELTLNTFADFQANEDPAGKDKIMHSMLTAPNGLVLMASDTPAGQPHTGPGSISISLSGDDDATLRGYWNKLSQDGTVLEPLVVAPWGDAFGMCRDRFGITWLVNIGGKPAA